MRILLTVLLVLSLSGRGDVCRYQRSGEVGWALKKEIRDKKSIRVEIAKLTNFKWDEMFLFGPYQPTSEVCKRLELSSIACKTIITAELADDGEMLMVFRLNGKVVHTEMHIRWHGDFTPVPDKPFTPRTAVFSVSVEGKDASGEGWLKLRPISEAGLTIEK
ncbi:hypothetical protein D3C78_735480 [compost metagenome]